jgi:hypothetical protein
MANKINETPHIKDTMDIICDILNGVGVESFVVTFDGGGDSGQVETASDFKPSDSVEAADKLLEEVVKGAKVSNGWRYGNGGREPIWEENPTLDRLINGLCYDILESVSSGWEINDGSHGTFHFDVKKRKMNLDFNERVIADRNYEFVL